MKTLTLIPGAGELDALVDHCHDGDTMTVLLFVPLVVRMDGVQAAELSTDKGKLAAKALADKAAHQVVTLTLHGREKYGRMLARVRLADGTDLSDWLIAQGLGVKWDGRGPRPFGKEENCGPPP